VANGLFAAGLGDTLVPNMAALPSSLAPTTGQRAFVRVWFSNTGNAGTFEALAPDTELRSVPFAREAGGVAGITVANLPQLNAANTFNHVNGLTVQGAAPVDNSPAAGVTVPVSGPGSRMEFIPGLAALRAGYVDGTQWDNIGLYSTALGFNTSAIGLRATALGNGTAANGIGSLSIGTGTTANGWNSTALGFSSVADGYAATALGRGTSALSEAEIALGSYNTSYAPSSWYGWSPTDRLLTVGNGSDSSNRHDALVILKSGDTTLNGNLTINGTITATNINGSGSTANVAKLDAANTFNNVSGITVQGPGPVWDAGAARFVPENGTMVPSGSGARMEFLPGCGAFRAGYVNNNQWDVANIGMFSTAMGYDTTASDNHSTAMGFGTWASGPLSTAIGFETRASGWASTAMGHNTIASGESSTAMGYRTAASGNYSTAMGLDTIAPSLAETVIGQFNTRYTPSSSSNWQTGDRLLVAGNGTSNTARADALIIYKNAVTVVTGTGPSSNAPAANASVPISGAGTRMEFIPGYSAFRAGTAEGSHWDAANIGLYSTALGSNTTASGNYSTALGDYTTASGDFSIAMGGKSTASGDLSTAMGHDTEASGFNSTAMGGFTKARGVEATAMGGFTIASGNASTAMGYWTAASGYASTAMGQGTIAPSLAETVIGQYNTRYSATGVNSWYAGDRLFVAGNGTSDSARADAFTVYKNGDTVIAGNAYALSFNTTSDRNKKTDIVAVDTSAILAGVAALPIAIWRFKEETATHLGPMAQDFAAAFHLGSNDTGIATVDADGVALASIQELKKQLDAKEARLAAVEADNAALADDNAALADENAIKSAEIADLQRQQAAIATDNAALKANLSDLAARLAALEAKLRE
jgi:hypothetical protein